MLIDLTHDPSSRPAPALLGRARVLAIALAVALAASGCAWRPRTRPMRERDTLELQSVVLTSPGGPGWAAERRFERGTRVIDLTHVPADGAPWDQRVRIVEDDDPARPPTVEAAATARELLADPAAVVEPVVAELPARFGPDATLTAVRGVESDDKAGVLVKAVASVAVLTFRSPGEPRRWCVLQLALRGAQTPGPPPLDDAWRALLDRVALRPATAANAASASARGAEFPKRLEPGLARRSLTLPQLGVQLSDGRERWIRRGAPWGSLHVAVGITDRLQLETPGYLRLSFGEVEALRRPEFAIGVGFLGVDDDPQRGRTWWSGASLLARWRIAADVALRGALAAEVGQEARTGRTRVGGKAAAGIVWDIHPLVSLGTDAGAWSDPSCDPRCNVVWVGGRSTPLVTFHLPPLDLGLTGAATWHDGRPDALVGFGVAATF